MPKLFGRDVSDHTYDLNRHLEKPPAADKTEARRILEAEMRQRFAMQFEAIWRLLDGPDLEREYKFCPDREWRADYLVVDTHWLIELEGGVFSGGRHTRAKGFIEDCFKYNMAALLGYRVIRIATGMINADYLQQIIDSVTGEEER